MGKLRHTLATRGPAMSQGIWRRNSAINCPSPAQNHHHLCPSLADLISQPRLPPSGTAAGHERSSASHRSRCARKDFCASEPCTHVVVEHRHGADVDKGAGSGRCRRRVECRGRAVQVD
eukprot:366048-Chlamydomonas_euryale.AAC.7